LGEGFAASDLSARVGCGTKTVISATLLITALCWYQYITPFLSYLTHGVH